MIEGSIILIADDEPCICDMLHDLLQPHGAQIYIAHSGEEAMACIETKEPDVAILDIRMPSPDGLQILQHFQEQGSDLPIIMMTGQDSSTLTIEAMQRGAYDYIRKPFHPDDITMTIERALEHRHLQRRVRTLEQQMVSTDPRDILIGQSSAMQEVYKLIGRVASTSATVLVSGESGTGKELVARVIHNNSSRNRKPFVTVNCAALPETLLESELFGHEKGAFTGAMSQRKGRFEQANRGTIFLDEIGEMSASTQKKLLRVLQERNFNRVGGNVLVNVDVRIIAATNRDLNEDVVAGKFREDLYYRLNVINIIVPPLRERKDDIPLLVQHFLAQQPQPADEQPFCITQEALEHLIAYDWPGNVRQLQNVIQRAAVLSHSHLIEAEHLLLPRPEPDSASDELSRTLNHLLDREEGVEAVVQHVYAQIATLAAQRHDCGNVDAVQWVGNNAGLFNHNGRDHEYESEDDDASTMNGNGNGNGHHTTQNGNGQHNGNAHGAEHEDDTNHFHQYLNLLMQRLNEPQRRWFAAVLSYAPNGPSIRKLVRITGLSSSTIMRGRRELASGLTNVPADRQRRVGGGRRARQNAT
jgi:DNA-binding NtrC family response regulator